MELFTFALSVYFFYHLLNRADMTSGIRSWLEASGLHRHVKYALRCCFCASFYLTLFSWFLYAVPFYWVYCVPVINLMIDALIGRE